MQFYRDSIDKNWDRHWATNDDFTGLFLRTASGDLQQISGNGQKAFKSLASFQKWGAKEKRTILAASSAY